MLWTELLLAGRVDLPVDESAGRVDDDLGTLLPGRLEGLVLPPADGLISNTNKPIEPSSLEAAALSLASNVPLEMEPVLSLAV